MIDVLKAGLDFFYPLGNIHEVDGKAGAFSRLDHCHVFRLKAGVQNDDTVGMIFGSVADQRGNRDIKVGDIVVVGGKEDGDFFAHNA